MLNGIFKVVAFIMARNSNRISYDGNVYHKDQQATLNITMNIIRAISILYAFENRVRVNTACPLCIRQMFI